MIHFVGYDAAGAILFVAKVGDEAARDAWPVPSGGGLLTISETEAVAVRASMSSWQVEDGELVSA